MSLCEENREYGGDREEEKQDCGDNYFDAGEIASDLGCQHVFEGIELFTSPVGNSEMGIRMRTSYTIQKGMALSIYPGVYSMQPESKVYNDSIYSYCVTIKSFHPGAKRVCILDAYIYRHTIDHGIGHIMNSSHPSLPPPYNKHNCYLAEEQQSEFDVTSRPPLVFVVACVDITTSCELLLDYHWRLTGKWSPLLGKCMTCNCINCSE